MQILNKPILTLLFLIFSSSTSAELPSIGSASTSALQLEQEHKIGQAWVRMIRAKTNMLDDPVVESYLQGLLWRLAPYSGLQDQRLTLLVIDSPEINAFAAPGGIIGINAGLIAAARREDELASVIAHEFAHLSQRHYAQQQAASDKNAPLVMAGIIGGILLAGINPDAGVALYQGTVGASISSQLAFSRSNETDADQTGMKTLVAAGFSASAMPRMFDLLQNANRFAGNQAPEFLRTHPVTQNRIADANNRAQSLQEPPAYKDSLEFEIARARVLAHLDTHNSISSAEQADQPVVDYLLAVKVADLERAQNRWNQLSPSMQTAPWLQLSRVKQFELAKQDANANALMAELIDLYPDDYAVQRAHITKLTSENRHADAIDLLREVVRAQPENPQNWYLLAEASGLVNDIYGLHQARVEYFLLRGDYDLALRQLEFARRDVRRAPERLEWVAQREAEVLAQRTEVDQLLR